MTKQSEYMEAFFGVELNQKFSDMISDLKEIEENLKELSGDIAKTGGNLSPDEFKVTLKECRASAYEFAQQIERCPDQFLEFYLKSDKILDPHYPRTRCIHEDLPDLQVGRN